MMPRPSADIETVAAHRYRPAARRKRSWLLSRLQSAILALVILDGIVVGWRADFVRALPHTASFYAAIGMPVNLRGVAFDELTTNTEQDEGVPILVVEGNVTNNAGKMIDVPRQICGAQFRPRGDLFLDRGATARSAGRRRSRRIPHQARLAASGRP
jgi:hypothetical protein